ncbi:unnamed protein product [Pseudo-nitzschia multistriata]|uniref:Uncharacterized protein n=1 Tax=Pseudo-nitzschia multistriata TaxID=183589 RepID=A0A448ZNV9_9STRA|nr:unnamed protein product [Pseudo-nitzschia multistriata]
MFELFDDDALNAAASSITGTSGIGIGTGSVRKRPRSPTRPPRATSPVPARASLGKPGAGVPDGKSLSRRLSSGSTASRNLALNDLLRITASYDINYALDGDHVVKALAGVFYDVIGWNPSDDGDGDENGSESAHGNSNGADGNENGGDEENSSGAENDDEPRFSPREAWKGPLTRRGRRWERFCRASLGRGNLPAESARCLEAVLTILRNLSFVSANLRLLAYSNDILSILVGCLYEPNQGDAGGDDGSNGIVLSALGILINLSPHLDVTGRKLFCDKLFLRSTAQGAPPEDGAKLPDPSTFGQVVNGSWGFGSLLLAKKLDTKEDYVQDIDKEMLLQVTKEYLVRVWAIFPALGSVLVDTRTPRAVVTMALELLQEFINQARVGVIGSVEDQDPDEIPNTRAILVYIPDDLLARLSDFLYIPRLGSDAIEYVDPRVTIVTRVNPIKLTVGYDGSVDTDVRDRALEVLVPLLELDSPGIAGRFGTKPGGSGLPNNKVFDAIFPILSTQSGRNEAPLLATQLLRELSKARENRLGCLYLQERIVALASKEPRVAHLAFNHLYASEED